MTPTTKAGRALLGSLCPYEHPDKQADAVCTWEQQVAAIEREAAAQERERIRTALAKHVDWHGWTVYGADEVDAILAEPSDGSGLDEPPHAGYYVGGPDGGEE